MSDKDKPRLWPRFAVGPKGNRAIFYGMGDIPHGWKLEVPLDDEPEEEEPHETVAKRPYTRRKPGRKPKAKADDGESAAS